MFEFWNINIKTSEEYLPHFCANFVVQKKLLASNLSNRPNATMMIFFLAVFWGTTTWPGLVRWHCSWHSHVKMKRELQFPAADVRWEEWPASLKRTSQYEQVVVFQHKTSYIQTSMQTEFWLNKVVHTFWSFYIQQFCVPQVKQFNYRLISLTVMEKIQNPLFILDFFK